jgi:hypothetical protein
VLGSSEEILNAFLEAFIPIINLIIVPVFIWIILPGVVTRILFKKKEAYAIGAFLGMIGLFTVGPLSNSSFL